MQLERLVSPPQIEMIGKTVVIATMFELHCAFCCVVRECAKCVWEQSSLACNEYRSVVQPARFSCEPMLYCATDKRSLCDSQMKVPKQLFVRPLASAHTLVQQPAYPSRTPAGQFWTAGGQHPREPLTLIQQAAGPPASALALPQANSTALLAAKIGKLQGAEFDAAAVLHDPEVQRRVTSAAAVAANVPHDAVLFHDLQPLDEVAVPVEAPKLVQKQLHPAWVAKRHLKPELSDLWTAEERHKPVITTAVAGSHINMSRSRIADCLLRFC